MTDPRSPLPRDDKFLTVRIGGNARHPERLLLIARPQGGTVRLREWTTDTWADEGRDVDIAPDELLQDIERAYSARLAVSEEIYRIRRWLEI